MPGPPVPQERTSTYLASVIQVIQGFKSVALTLALSLWERGSSLAVKKPGSAAFGIRLNGAPWDPRMGVAGA
jgi:hypothetical protein